MRQNTKAFTGVCFLLLIFWAITAFFSSYDVAVLKNNVKYSDNLIEMESRIERLEKQLDRQLAESNDLLEKVHAKLANEIYKKKEIAEDEIVITRKSELKPVLPVLVIACNRVTVSRCLDKLIKIRPNKETFPIIVSQDCGHNKTYEVIKKYTDRDPTITLIRQPNQSDILLPNDKVKFKGYYKIARHFKFALHYVLAKLGHEAVIIVEDDLDMSPDFFEYFQGVYPLLLKDPSLWCISAWNDNGKPRLIDISHPELLHRTEFFPGLGWLLQRQTWLRLEPRWPQGFFDDWLRDPANVEGKACIRPEISRTYSFGKVGVSKGLYFDKHLKNMHLNREFVEFTKLNLTYLLKENYDKALESTVRSLPVMTADDVLESKETHPVVVLYSNAKSYQGAAKRLGLMEDFRSGVPRTAYRGIVTCFVQGRRVYLAPKFQWTKYDPSWS